MNIITRKVKIIAKKVKKTSHVDQERNIRIVVENNTCKLNKYKDLRNLKNM